MANYMAENSKLTNKIFADGIAFYKDNEEIAFYSKITKKVRYILSPDWIGCDCVEIDAEINFAIIEEVKANRDKWVAFYASDEVLEV